MIVDCHFHWPYRDERAVAEDPAAALDVMDRHGIDKAVLMAFEGLCRLGAEQRENEILSRMAGKEDQEGGRQEGLSIALETVEALSGKEGLRGFGFSGNADHVLAVIERSGLKTE